MKVSNELIPVRLLPIDPYTKRYVLKKLRNTLYRFIELDRRDIPDSQKLEYFITTCELIAYSLDWSFHETYTRLLLLMNSANFALNIENNSKLIEFMRAVLTEDEDGVEDLVSNLESLRQQFFKIIQGIET